MLTQQNFIYCAKAKKYFIAESKINIFSAKTNFIFTTTFQNFHITTMNQSSELLIELVKVKMPFGRYKETVLCNLPISYLEWFNRKGFPEGKLGMLLQTMYEIKLNGLTHLLEPLKKF